MHGACQFSMRADDSDDEETSEDMSGSFGESSEDDSNLGSVSAAESPFV